MSRTTVQLFVTPGRNARSRARIEALRAALEALGADVIVTDSAADRLTVDPRADHACAVGGDGTLRHVVDAVRRAGRPVSLSAYPVGTINLLARECAYSRDPQVFARRLLAGETPRQHHVARVGAVPLLVCASVGPDSHAVAGVSSRLKRVIGRAAYVVAFCRLLVHWPRATITLRHDDRESTCEAVYVAKGRFFAGRWSFAPAATLGDPLLHVIALRQASRMRFLRFAWTLLSQRPVDALPGVTYFTCTELTVASDTPLPLQGDGDIIAALPLTITSEAQAFRFA